MIHVMDGLHLSAEGSKTVMREIEKALDQRGLVGTGMICLLNSVKNPHMILKSIHVATTASSGVRVVIRVFLLFAAV